MINLQYFIRQNSNEKIQWYVRERSNFSSHSGQAIFFFFFEATNDRSTTNIDRSNLLWAISTHDELKFAICGFPVPHKRDLPAITEMMLENKYERIFFFFWKALEDKISRCDLLIALLRTNSAFTIGFEVLRCCLYCSNI